MHFGHWNFFALMRAKIPLSQKRLSKNCGIVKIVSMKVIHPSFPVYISARCADLLNHFH